MCEELLSIIDAWQGKRIVIVGDVCHDQWQECTPRVNPECDAPCFTLGDTIRSSYGMAHLVGQIVESLGGVAKVASRSEVAVKLRLMSRDQQVSRLDVDPEPMHKANEQELAAMASTYVRYHADAAIISDYGKGACSDVVCSAAIMQSVARGVPLLVDPARGADWRKYTGATWIKANVVERREGPTVWHDLCDAMIVTEGELGMQIHKQRAPVTMIDATPRHAVDPCGCGDACAAVLGLCLAVRAPIDLACRLANHAGGLAVEQHGTPRITAAMLREDVRRMAAVCSDASSRPTSTRK